jgi:hypothetical protein
MIRIDEIYNHTFWPWLEKNRPGTRLFFCDPFGHTTPQSLYNHGSDIIQEEEYVFMHDQEPIQLVAHSDLFDDVVKRNLDIIPRARGHVIVSERGEMVDRLCDIYGWKHHYYFFHGWACLDWYRGYDRTFLFDKPTHRKPTKTIMSPNRIVGGERAHRVLFIYHLLKKNLPHNHISAPRSCPYEKVDITTIASQYDNIYPDIEQVLNDSSLPWLFQGEDIQHMTSCWLGNFTESNDSLIYVPTETVYFGRRTHITEKTFKAIALGMPFVLVAAAGSLEYLKEYGFQTFDHIWDESYDTNCDDLSRLEQITELLADIDSLSIKEKQQIHQHCLPVIEHNWNHFYHGGLEKLLWQELCTMLNNI